MKNVNLGNVFALFLLLSSAILIGGCNLPFKHQQFQNQYASGGILRPLLPTVFVHSSSESYYLKLGGKTFSHVRGLPPYYLEVPQTHALLFVTGEVDHGATFHLFNLTSRKFKTIQCGMETETCGWDIGTQRKKGEQFSEWIENASSNRVTFASERGNIGLDFDSGTAAVPGYHPWFK